MVEGDDVSLWKRGSDYQTMFSTYETWELIRVVQQKCGISHSNHTTSWNEIIRSLSGSQMDFRSRLCIRYAMQAAIHMIWCERNKRLHGKAPRSA
ncbi:unnamed protein product, partial [Brassica rapa]